MVNRTELKKVCKYLKLNKTTTNILCVLHSHKVWLKSRDITHMLGKPKTSSNVLDTTRMIKELNKKVPAVVLVRKSVPLTFKHNDGFFAKKLGEMKTAKESIINEKGEFLVIAAQDIDTSSAKAKYEILPFGNYIDAEKDAIESADESNTVFCVAKVISRTKMRATVEKV